jgi:hypothetical protein
MEIPFIGGAYEQRSLSINAQRSINCFPVVDKQDAKTIVAMYGTPGLAYFTKPIQYGSGADGTVTISVDTTLTADMQYDALTVNSGITLNTSGFVIMCKTSLTNNGTITDTDSGGTGGTSTVERGGKGGGRVIIWAKSFTNNSVIHADGFAAGSEAVSGADGGLGGTPTKSGAGYGGSGAYSALIPAAGGQAGSVIIYYDTKVTEGTVRANPGLGAYGTGADGAVTISSNTSLTANMNYTNLTINSGKILNTAGFIIRCTGDLVNNGTITDSTNKAAGGGAGATKTGGYWEGGAGNTGSAGASAAISGAGKGGNGGHGGGAGGGCGDNEWGNRTGGNGGAGGAGGAGGGRVLIYAKTITNNGTIDVAGAAGAAGSAGTQGGSNYFEPFDWPDIGGGGGGGMGGSGGDGGTIILMGYSYDNYNIITVAGGAGGAGGVHGNRGPDQPGGTKSGHTHWAGGSASSWTVGGVTRSAGAGGQGSYGCQHGYDGTDGAAGFDGTNGTFGAYEKELTDIPIAGAATLTQVTYGAYSSAALRGGIVVGTNLYLVVGANIIKVTSAGVTSQIGALTTSTGNVFMASNGTQILVVDGTVYGHYITIATAAFTDVTLPVAASSVTFMDGYFIITKASGTSIYISGLYDATSWDAGDNAVVEGNPDNVLRTVSSNNTLWLFGEESTEVWYDSGATDFPFARISGALLNKGLGAVASVVLLDNQFILLSNDREVVMTSGYQFNKISTIHIDTELQGYSTVSDAIGWSYKIDGHVFYVLTFPTADHTWVFDVTTGFWHEWQSYKTAGVATFGRHRATMGFYIAGKYIVGDHSNGSLYEMSMTTYTDDGELIKRTRRAQYINKDRKRIFHKEINLEFEPGVGLVGTGSGSDPQVGLTWSDDGGNNWATIQYRDLGELEDYTARQRWLRLGMSRNRIYELTMYEPVKFVLAGASAELEGEAA